ncbi:MAG: hypothetical protein IPP71_18725 [Bacteroidetes bacterium]|nr:hypothetical protein [Bacteroidota bacterium]
MKGLPGNVEVVDSTFTIAPDTFLLTQSYKDFIQYRILKEKILNHEEVNPDLLIQLNPQFYQAYVLAGDYLFTNKSFTKAKSLYETALTKEIATKNEEDYIKEQIKKCSGN